MSDLTDIVSAMGGYQAATQQDRTALETVLGARGGRQKTGNSSFSIFNTQAKSTLLSSQVDGEPAIYATGYPRIAALKARIVAVRNRRLALIPRITALEGATPGTVTIPPDTPNPAYGPTEQVVTNANRFSGFLDETSAGRSTETGNLALTRARINALKNPPAQRAFFSDPFFSDPLFTRT